MAKVEKGRVSVVEQLRQAIRQSGQTLNQLSQQCGVGRDQLSRFLRGRRDLTLETADRVCQALGLELSPRIVEPAEPPAAEPSGEKRPRRKKGKGGEEG
jgi:transcriptional regulator with XRE-family HTH domain